METELNRSLPVNSIRAVEENERRFVLSFSSEEPYERYFGPEILDHNGCELERLKTIGVVLFNHNREKVIGKIISAEVNNSRGEAVIEFDDDEFSETIRKKVATGTLKGVSVGYSVKVWEEVKSGVKSSDKRFTGPCYIARNWMPYEISIVSVPADSTVGVGRDYSPRSSSAIGTAERLLLHNKNLYERSR